MQITAVIAEYNPFHFGHRYQLEQIKKHSDAAVVIMSGPFVQRGEAAITDKWTRARAALLNGADLVLELPVIFALASAREFASGAVSLLDRTRAIDKLCFGTESGDAEALIKAAEIIENEPPQVSGKIKALVSEGMSYPAARELAFSELFPGGLLSSPNNILAIEYIRALMRIDSAIEPMPILREGSGYHDIEVNKFASASGIRSRIFSGQDISELLPCPDFEIYSTSVLDTAVTACLRTMAPERLAEINGVSEGLENRIIRAALMHSSINDIAAAVKTKRYTLTRIKRILLSSLLGITHELASMKPNYIRVLGMNVTGAEVLRLMKQNITVITKAADYKANDPVFAADIRAQNIFSLCGDTKKGNEDLTTSPVIVK